MDKIESQIKQVESNVNDNSQKIKIASNTNFLRKEELLQKLIGKDVVKTKMINVAGEMFIQYEKELDDTIKKKLKNNLVMIKIKMMS